MKIRYSVYFTPAGTDVARDQHWGDYTSAQHAQSAARHLLAGDDVAATLVQATKITPEGSQR